MDVLVLIDKLDDLVHNAKLVPMTGQVRVDKDEIYDILDQMRATIPEEIKEARFIVEQRKRGESPGAAGGSGGIDQRALTDAVTEAIRANIPEIARAAAAASSQRPTPPPPGGPF